MAPFDPIEALTPIHFLKQLQEVDCRGESFRERQAKVCLAMSKLHL